MERSHMAEDLSKPRHVSISNLDTALQAFTFDLPDADIELFHQQIEERTFTAFNKLPIEIRLKIWGSSLPCGRFVKLSLYEERKLLLKHSVTLKVNRESRSETLHHYQPLLKEPTSFLALGLPQQKIVFFDPVVDTLAVDTVMGFWENSRALEILAFNRENILNARYVIVDQFVWHESQALKIVDGSHEYLFPLLTFANDESRPPMSHYYITLHHFRKIEKLALVAVWVLSQQLQSEKGREDHTNWLLIYFQRRAEQYPDCKVPEVSLWQDTASWFWAAMNGWWW